MEKEIKVRKRRFAAFWTAVLLLCGMVLPTVVSAADYEITVTDNMTVNGLDSGSTLYENDTIYYANAAEGSFTVTYQDSEWKTLDSVPVAYNEKYTVAPYSSLPEGATFLGWTVETVSASGGVLVSVTLTAETSTEYTITFDTAGGSTVGPITANYGDPITAPADPTREDYYFAGWDQKIPDTMPAGNMTITATWTPYVINAGTYDMKAGVKYQLGTATRVSGDSSTYYSGSVFYVPADGSYTFK